MAVIRLKLREIKKGFFDRKLVHKKVSDADRKNLSRLGAFIRRAAKSSIRRRRRVSAPGEPPSSHLGLLRDFIFFAYDFSRRSVVVGPTLLNQGSGTAPKALEEGGESDVITGRRNRRMLRRVHIRARPYMKPALEKGLRQVKIWKNSVR